MFSHNHISPYEQGRNDPYAKVPWHFTALEEEKFKEGQRDAKIGGLLFSPRTSFVLIIAIISIYRFLINPYYLSHFFSILLSISGVGLFALLIFVIGRRLKNLPVIPKINLRKNDENYDSEKEKTKVNSFLKKMSIAFFIALVIITLSHRVFRLEMFFLYSEMFSLFGITIFLIRLLISKFRLSF